MAPIEILVLLADFPGLRSKERLFLAEKLDNMEELAVLSSIEGLSLFLGRTPEFPLPSKAELEERWPAEFAPLARIGAAREGAPRVVDPSGRILSENGVLGYEH